MNASLERLFIRRRTNTPPPISPTQQLAAAAGPDLRLDDLGEGRGDLDHDVVAPVPSLQIVRIALSFFSFFLSNNGLFISLALTGSEQLRSTDGSRLLG